MELLLDNFLNQMYSNILRFCLPVKELMNFVSNADLADNISGQSFYASLYHLTNYASFVVRGLLGAPKLCYLITSFFVPFSHCQLTLCAL